jgi:hypothetical protein
MNLDSDVDLQWHQEIHDPRYLSIILRQFVLHASLLKSRTSSDNLNSEAPSHPTLGEG